MITKQYMINRLLTQLQEIDAHNFEYNHTHIENTAFCYENVYQRINRTRFNWHGNRVMFEVFGQ